MAVPVSGYFGFTFVQWQDEEVGHLYLQSMIWWLFCVLNKLKKKNLVEIMSTYFEIRVFVHVGACLIKTKQLLRR